MDYDSSVHFLSSLAKFLQSLCNGYIQFDNGVQINGHLYLSIDTDKTIDYVLNEKVFKTDEEGITFTSDSFYAQPAERPGQAKTADSSDIDVKSKLKAKLSSANHNDSPHKRQKLNKERKGHRVIIGNGNALQDSVNMNADRIPGELLYPEISSNTRIQSSNTNISQQSDNNAKKNVNSPSKTHNDAQNVTSSWHDDSSDVQSGTDEAIVRNIKREPSAERLEGDFIPMSEEHFAEVLKQEITPSVELDMDAPWEGGHSGSSMNDSYQYKTGNTEEEDYHLNCFSSEQIQYLGIGNPHVVENSGDTSSDVHPLFLFANPANIPVKYGLRKKNVKEQKQGRIKRKYLEVNDSRKVPSKENGKLNKVENMLNDQKAKVKVQHVGRNSVIKRKNQAPVAIACGSGEKEESPLMKIVERLKKQKESAAVLQSRKGEAAKAPAVFHTSSGMKRDSKDCKSIPRVEYTSGKIKAEKDATKNPNKNKPAKSCKSISSSHEQLRNSKDKLKQMIMMRNKKIDNCDTTRKEHKTKVVSNTKFEIKKCVDKVNEISKQIKSEHIASKTEGEQKRMSPEDKRLFKNKRRMQYYYAKRAKEIEKTKEIAVTSEPLTLHIEEKSVIQKKQRKQQSNAKNEDMTLTKKPRPRTHTIPNNVPAVKREKVEKKESSMKGTNCSITNSRSSNHATNGTILNECKENAKEEKIDNTKNNNPVAKTNNSKYQKMQSKMEKRLIKNKKRMEYYYAQQAKKRKERESKELQEMTKEDVNQKATNEMTTTVDVQENGKLEKNFGSMDVEVNGVVISIQETNLNVQN